MTVPQTRKIKAITLKRAPHKPVWFIILTLSNISLAKDNKGLPVSSVSPGHRSRCRRQRPDSLPDRESPQLVSDHGEWQHLHTSASRSGGQEPVRPRGRGLGRGGGPTSDHFDPLSPGLGYRWQQPSVLSADICCERTWEQPCGTCYSEAKCEYFSFFSPPSLLQLQLRHDGYWKQQTFSIL